MSMGTETLKKLQVVLTGNTQQLTAAMKQAEKATTDATTKMQSGLDKVGSALKSVGKIAAAAISVKAIVSFGQECVQLGSDLTEVQNVVDVTFGSMASKINDFAKTSIKTFGISETAAKNYASTMGSMLKSMGFTADRAADMSISLAGLAGDLASFRNMSADEAFSKIRSGISGETEPLKQLGINMSVANLEAYALSQGISKAFNSMTQMEQATLRYKYILDATKDAHGDAARTSGEWAGQMRTLSMQFDQFKATIGQGLIMALTPVIQIVNKIMEALTQLAEKFRVVMAAITGTSLNQPTDGIATNLEEAADLAADTGENLTDGIKDAETAVKRFLMSFDEIHKVSGDTVSEDGLGALADTSTLGSMESLVDATQDENDALAGIDETLASLQQRFEPVIDKVKTMANEFKEGFEDGVGDNVQEKVDDIIENVSGIAGAVSDIFNDEDLQQSVSDFADTASNAFGDVAGSATSIGLTVGQNVTGGLDKALNKNKGRISKWMQSILGSEGGIISKAGELSKSIAKIFEPLGSESGQETTGNILSVVGNTYMGVTELAAKTADDVANIWSKPIIMNTDSINQSMTDIVDYTAEVSGVWDEAVQHMADTANDTYDASIHPLMESIADGSTDTFSSIMDAFNTHLKPMLDQAAEAITNLWNEHIKPTWDQLMDVVSKIGDALKLLWENILQPVVEWVTTAIVDTLMPIITDIWTTVVKVVGDIVSAIGGILETLGGLIDFVVGVFTGDWEKAWEGIKSIFQGVWDFISGILTGIGDLVIGTLNSVIDFFGGIGRAIGSGFDSIVNWGKGILGIENAEPTLPDSDVRTEVITPELEAAWEENRQLNQEAIKTALAEALAEQPVADTVLEIDGEQLAKSIDKARSVRNTRVNPQISYGTSGG